MKTRLILAASLLLGLSGCATYDYVDGGGGYYHGSPQVQRNYPYGGYPGGYGGYGYGGYYDGYYGGYGYPTYRPPYNPPPRPPYNGHRPPPHGNGHVPPPRPGNDGDGRPTRPPPPTEGSGKSPWRDMDRLQRPQPPRGTRPTVAESQPPQRIAPPPRSEPSARPAPPPRSAPEQRPSQNREDRRVRQVEP